MSTRVLQQLCTTEKYNLYMVINKCMDQSHAPGFLLQFSFCTHDVVFLDPQQVKVPPAGVIDFLQITGGLGG